MNLISSVFSFLFAIVFMGYLCLSNFNQVLYAQTTSSADLFLLISEIEIKGTSELESSQILFLIESQVGEPLSRKADRKSVV